MSSTYKPIVSRRLFWLLLVVLPAAGMVFYWLRPSQQASLHRVLPTGAALVLEWNGLPALDSLTNAAPETGMDLLTGLPFWHTLRGDWDRALDLALADTTLLSALRTQSCLFAASLSAADSLHGMFAVRVPANFDLDRFVNKSNVGFRETRMHKHRIFTLRSAGGFPLTFAQYDGIFLFSRHAYLVEDALKEQTRFWKKSVLPTDLVAAEPARLRLWAPSSLLAGLIPALGDRAAALDPYAPWVLLEWSDFGVHFHVSTPGGGARFIEGFLADRPAGIPADVLPASVAAVASITLDDPGALAWAGAATDRQAFKDYIQPWMGQTIGVGLALPDAGHSEDNRFILLAAADARQAEASLRAYGAARGFVRAPRPYQTFEVFEFLQASAIRSLGGAAFERPVAAVVGGYVLFAARRDLLERWIDQYVVGQTLSNDPFFLQLEQQTRGSGSVMLYANGAWLATLLNREMADDPFTCMRLALVPTDWTRRQVEGRLFFQAAGEAQQLAELVWKTPLRAPIAAGPIAALHPDGDRPALMVQDAQNLLYCLDEQGKIIWTRQLDGRMLGAVHTRAARDRLPLAYILNTSGKIYLLDARGRDADGFPLSLQTPASNGMTCVDINHDGRPVLLVGCMNGSLYGFDDYGRPLPGWNPRADVGIVRFPLRHIAHRQSDYLAALNEAGVLWLLGRDGQPHGGGPVQLPEPVEWPVQLDTLGSEPAFILFGASGGIYSVNTEGKLYPGAAARADKRQRGGLVVSGNYAVLRDDRLWIVRPDRANEKPVRFSGMPDTLFDTGGPGFGVFSRSEKRIWWYDTDGRLAPGFPLAGAAAFVRSAADPNLIFTGLERELYAYRLPGKLSSTRHVR